MTRNVDHVVDTAADPVEAFVVPGSAVTGELTVGQYNGPFERRKEKKKQTTYVITGIDIQVGVHVLLMSTIDGTSHARPRLLKRQDTLNIVAVNLLARYGVDNSRLDAKEGKRCTAGLGGGNAGQGGDDVGARFCLPVCLQRLREPSW